MPVLRSVRICCRVVVGPLDVGGGFFDALLVSTGSLLWDLRPLGLEGRAQGVDAAEAHSGVLMIILRWYFVLFRGSAEAMILR